MSTRDSWNRRRSWVLTACAAAGVTLGAAAVLLGRLIGTGIPWLVAVVGGLATGALVGLGVGVTWGDPAPSPPPSDARGAPAADLGDLASLVFAVDNASRDRDRFETRLRPRLIALASDRLWQVHGIDWRTPDGRRAAEDVVGPHLLELLTAPSGALRLTPTTLHAWIDDLESM